ACDVKLPLRQVIATIGVTDLAADLRANTAIRILDLVLEARRNGIGDGVLRVLQNVIIERTAMHTIVALAGAVARCGWVVGDVDEEAAEVERVCLRMIRNKALLEELRAADQISQAAHTELCHDLA